MSKLSVKKQLLIAYNFPPLANAESIVTAKMVKGIKERGWHTEVCTVKPKSDPASNDKDLLDLLPAGLEIHRCPSLPGDKLTRLLRVLGLQKFGSLIGSFPDEKIFWLPTAVMKINQLVKNSNYRVIYSTSFPITNHLLGYLTKKKFGLPWLANFSDPWVDSPFYSPTLNSLKNLHSYWEKKIVESADIITFPNDGFLSLVMAKYPRKLKNKCHVIPHSYTPFNSVDPENSMLDTNKLNVVYLGTFHGQRTPLPLFEALKIFKKDINSQAKLRIYLIGRMPHENYEKIIRKYDIENLVKLIKPLPYNMAMEYAYQATVLLTVDPISKNSDIFMSSKLIEYLGLEKSIWGLLTVPGVGSSFAKSLDLYMADIRKRESIVSSLKEIYRSWETGSLKSINLKNPEIQNYNINNTSKKLAIILNSMNYH
jgi:hypothetical protein